ncbi:MAG: MipA/OmpV family protein [Candidatus Thiodiazotropha sp.]
MQYSHKRLHGIPYPGRKAMAVLLSAICLLGDTSVQAGEWWVGGNLGGGRNPLVGEDGYAVLVPVVAYCGERFYANLGNPGPEFFRGMGDFAGLGYHLLDDEQFTLDLVGKFGGLAVDPDDNDELDGLDERKPGFNMGLSARWDTGLGELNGQVLTDVSGRSKGQELVASYAYPLSFGAWQLRPELGVSWVSQDSVDYYVGVDEDEVRPGRAAYEGDAAAIPFASIQADYALTERTHLIGGIGVGRLGDGIADSPIIEERNLVGGYVGAVYRF